MPQYDREAYQDGSEPPLTFETRRPVRSGGPAPITLVLSLLLLVVIGAGVFFLYRGGIRGPSDVPRPVGTPIGDVRTPAPAEAQSVDPAVGLSIYKDNSNTDAAAPAFAPPPETPGPRPVASPPAAHPVAAPPPPPAPAQVATAEVSTPPAPPPVSAVAKTANAPSSAPLVPPAAPAPMAPPAKASPGPEPSGTAVVQIGAFSSSLQADQGWNAAAGVAPAAMAGKGKKVVTVAKDGTTLYRTSITGFATRQEAQALCAKLQAAGRNCFVR